MPETADELGDPAWPPIPQTAGDLPAAPVAWWAWCRSFRDVERLNQGFSALPPERQKALEPAMWLPRRQAESPFRAVCLAAFPLTTPTDPLPAD